MPRLDWYAFYPADYRRDTRHLNRAQHMAYRTILDEIFEYGQQKDPPSIPDDDDYLSTLCMADSAEEWTETRRVLFDERRPLLRMVGAEISQNRMGIEIKKAQDRSGHAKVAAETRWAAREQKSDARPKRNAGNGNGAATEGISEAQYFFYSSRIGKWRIENSHRWVGLSDNSQYEADFFAEFGMTWARWKEEQARHAS